jgi:hypothetical protein
MCKVWHQATQGVYGSCASLKGVTGAPRGVSGGAIIRAQLKEVRGSTVDANGRNPGSFEIIITIYEEGEHCCSPYGTLEIDLPIWVVCYIDPEEVAIVE